MAVAQSTPTAFATAGWQGLALASVLLVHLLWTSWKERGLWWWRAFVSRALLLICWPLALVWPSEGLVPAEAKEHAGGATTVWNKVGMKVAGHRCVTLNEKARAACIAGKVEAEGRGILTAAEEVHASLPASQATPPEPPPALRPAAPPSGLLGATIVGFRAAVAPATLECLSTGLSTTPLLELQREPLLEGLDAFAIALDTLGGSMGSYLRTNIAKLRRSKASRSQAGYRPWLLSELPVHASTGYKCYADDSAWMANLWIGWSLEFFVELFAELEQGRETKESAEAAYNRSLYGHHNFFQRAAFKAAVGKLPARRDMPASVLADVAEFVRLGRGVVEFCLRVNTELDERRQLERRYRSR